MDDITQNKITIMVPYFGKLPEHFPIWLKSCEYNADYTWIIVTDDKTNFEYPQNVKKKYSTLQELKSHFEKILGVKLQLNKSYKLCDYRPLYGVLFSEYLKNSTHWGYCDLDMIFGKLSNFICDKDLVKYDKINVLGHISIIKNNKNNNNAFKKVDYINILNDNRNRTFDEVRFEPNINTILAGDKKVIKKTIPYADVYPLHYDFRLYQYFEGNRTTRLPRRPVVFKYDNGNLFEVSQNKAVIEERELAYVHFSSRNISVKTNNFNKFILQPNEIRDYEIIDMKYLNDNSKDNIGYATRKYLSKINKTIKNKKDYYFG